MNPRNEQVGSANIVSYRDRRIELLQPMPLPGDDATLFVVDPPSTSLGA